MTLRTQLRWLLRASTLVPLLVGPGATAARAQQLPIKPSLSTGGPAGCASFPVTTTAPPAGAPLTDDSEARRLIADGQEAALQGEHRAARDAFVKAAARAPHNARVAYYLGREHEALDSSSAAVREYCRYLGLAPNAPDGDEVRGRISRLVPVSDLARVEEARANFRSGVALLERRQFVAADSVFGVITRQLPTAAEAFYNRALARAARGERAPAIEDFEKYLELLPTAPDRAPIRATITRLPDRVYRSEQALVSGLIVPGLGQMNTGRPVFGVAVLGGVLGAAFFGLQQKTSTELRQFTDPFGNPYTQEVTTRERKNLALGAAGAAVLWLGAAFESMLHARSTRERAESIIRPSGSVPRTGRPGIGARGSHAATLSPYLQRDVATGMTTVGLSFRHY